MGKNTSRWLAGFVIHILMWTGYPAFGQERPPSPPSEVKIPKEPGWNSPAYRGWELLSIPGLIATYYDLDLDGKLDYQVIRKIIRKGTSDKTTIKQAIESARIDNLTVYVSKPIIYFTSKYPLFYCLGVDFRRNCRNIWIDVQEDGLNGNETLYTLSIPKHMVR
ncbi:MAG: hypothetical protein GWM98_16645 [Nitrospinaceae bacterium]|nr:hypothetical protein [Nitrospinaceae bacterium]NIR55818.1 hypothetical protein [Nitrospinaceae bacterium]NIS86271.1 hypothetical protein [Nitrospinaceae bacterium]NIT83100.1 hypothetical protein [Nitrospinaceae bacterium]NIU45310.1 hypothetical protein [Nitrospinaceae bacterium]